jgi:hypothetical protein
VRNSLSDPERPRTRRRRGHYWWLVWGLLGVVVLGVAFAGWKAWDGLYVRESEARNALLRLPYDLRFRRVSTPDGLSAVIAGQGRARDGTTLNFAILLGGAGTDTEQLTIVPGAGHASVTQLGNATVITNSATTGDERRKDAELDMTLAIEDAIFDRAPLRPRED